MRKFALRLGVAFALVSLSVPALACEGMMQKTTTAQVAAPQAVASASKADVKKAAKRNTKGTVPAKPVSAPN